MPVEIFTGIETPDGVAVTIGSGQCLRMHCWINVARRSVESRLMRVQDDGAEVEVFRRTVYTVTADFGPDCLKVIASGNVVVAHWLEGEEVVGVPGTWMNPVIRRFTFDLDGLDSAAWTDRGTLSVVRFMHDLQPVIGHASDFVIAFISTADACVVRRYNGLAWVDIDWDASANGGTAVALRCISVYANDDDDDALVTFEGTGGAANEVWSTRFVAADGSSAATVQSFTALPPIYLFQATHARYGARDVALLVEVAPTENDVDVPMVAGTRLSSLTAAPLTSEHAVYHLRLLGQAFTFAGARETSSAPNLYALVGYKQAVSDEFGNSAAWVANFSAIDWGDASDNTVRPRPCATFNFGDIDTRTSGATPDGSTVLGWGTERRCGHLPHAQAAPETGRAVKTRTWSVLGFAKLMAMSTSALVRAPLQPVAADVKGLRFFVEEPWVIHRDGSEPAAPTTCYRGENPHVVGALRDAAAGAAIGGGCPAYYDGSRVVPIGYPWPPEAMSVTEGAAGNLTAGTYLYVATWEWRDAAGQLHRSAPGPIFEHESTGSFAVSVVIGTLSFDTRDDAYHHPGSAPINCVLWRTEVGGLVFYRVYASTEASGYPVRNTAENDPFGDVFTITDNISDATLVQHEALPYQLIDGSFNPLPPYPPPASNAIAKWQNRIFLQSSQDLRVINYSQEMLPEPGGIRTLPPEFSPGLQIRIDGLGRVLAMEPRDQELVLFTSDAIYSISGFGADGSGQNASYQVTEIMSGIGCIDARSIVSTAAGVFFQGHHGLYCLVGSSVEHVQIGAKVLDVIRTGGNLRGACYLKDRAAVRWVTNGAPSGEPLMLELDLQTMRWSVSPLALGDQPGGSDQMCATAGSTVWMGTNREALHVVLQAGAILIEWATTDATPYADQNRSGAVAVPLRVQLNPVHLDGIDGFVLLRRVGLAFEKPNASGIRITHYAWREGRYEDATGQVIDYASPALERPRPYGPRSQKCAAFWIDISELTAVPSTENLRIVGIHIEAGIKRGLRKA